MESQFQLLWPKKPHILSYFIRVLWKYGTYTRRFTNLKYIFLITLYKLKQNNEPLEDINITGPCEALVVKVYTKVATILLLSPEINYYFPNFE